LHQKWMSTNMTVRIILSSSEDAISRPNDIDIIVKKMYPLDIPKNHKK